MDVGTRSSEATLHGGATGARLGLIIPSVNVLAEPQFNRFAPSNLSIHIARARVAGKWKRPLAEMADEIATSARLLSDCNPNMIVFHCTDTSMAQGLRGEGKILDIVREASGVEAMATSRLVLDALRFLKIQKVALISPYTSNQAGIDYLNSAGIDVTRPLPGQRLRKTRQWHQAAQREPPACQPRLSFALHAACKTSVRPAGFKSPRASASQA